MATFRVQVEGLTQLTMAGLLTPSLAELNSFLQDGLKDVVNRIIVLKPQELTKFGKTSEDTGSGVDVSGQIITVNREHDSTTILRPCSYIDPIYRTEAKDSSSLHYRSKYNPGFYVLEGKAYVVPDGTASGNNRGQITQVHYDTGLTHDDSPSGIDNFPEEYSHLIALYAAMRSVLSYMGELDGELPSDLTLPVLPVPPSLSDTTLASLSTAPTYTKPSIAADFSGVDSSITDDDPEMANIKLQKVSNELSEYQADLQNELNEFNKENSIYQTDMQKKIKDAELEQADESQELQLYSAEVQAYASEVQNLIADYQAKIANLGSRYQWAQARYTALAGEYNNAFGIMAPKQQQKG